MDTPEFVKRNKILEKQIELRLDAGAIEIAGLKRSMIDVLGIRGKSRYRTDDAFGLEVYRAMLCGKPRDLPSWQLAIDEGRLPVFRGMHLSEDDQLRADLIQQLMCQGRVDIDELQARHHIDFHAYFAADLARLQPLVADGLAIESLGQVTVTPRGRLLLRIIAACFDRYLHASQDAPTRFSRAI